LSGDQRENPLVDSELQQTGLNRSEGMSEDERAFLTFPWAVAGLKVTLGKCIRSVNSYFARVFHFVLCLTMHSLQSRPFRDELHAIAEPVPRAV
jgi:hypothetical protein